MFPSFGLCARRVHSQCIRGTMLVHDFSEKGVKNTIGLGPRKWKKGGIFHYFYILDNQDKSREVQKLITLISINCDIQNNDDKFSIT